MLLWVLLFAVSLATASNLYAIPLNPVITGFVQDDGRDGMADLGVEADISVEDCLGSPFCSRPRTRHGIVKFDLPNFATPQVVHSATLTLTPRLVAVGGFSIHLFIYPTSSDRVILEDFAAPGSFVASHVINSVCCPIVLDVSSALEQFLNQGEDLVGFRLVYCCGGSGEVIFIGTDFRTPRLGSSPVLEFSSSPRPVPAPSTMLLLGSGLATLGFFRPRRKLG